MASHEFEYFLTRMLKWYIEVGEKSFEFLKLFEMRKCEDIWIEIVDSESEISFDSIDRFEHLHESGFSIEVSTVSSRVL